MPGMPGMLDEDEFGVFFGAPSGLAPQATILPLPKPATAPIGKDGKVIEDDDDVYTQLFGPPPAVPMPPRYVFAKPIMPLVVLPAAAQLPVPVGRPGAGKAAQGATRNGTSAAAGAPQSEGGGAGAAAGGRGWLAGSLEGGAALGLASGGPSMEMIPLQGAPAPPPEEDDDFEVTLEELDTATMAAAAVAAGGTTTAPAAGPAAGVAAATGGRLGSVGSGSLPGLGPPPPPPPGEVAAAGRVPPPRPPPGGPPLPPGGPPGVVPGPKPPAGGPPVPGPGAGPKFGPGPPGGRPFLPRQPQPIYGLNFRYSIEEAAWPTEARLDQAIKLPKQTRVTPEEYRAFLSLGHGEIFELDLDRIIPHEALWRNPSANPGDYFNYDMNETSWRHYCARVRTYRDTFTLRTRIAVLDPAAVAAVLACSPAGATRPGGGPNAVEWIDPALPSEVVAALRAWQRSGRKGQRREEEEEDVAAAAAATTTAESIVFSEMTIDITAMGGGDWDGNEGGYGMLAGRLGREAPLNRRTTPRLDTDVIISLTEAEDFVEEEEEPTPTTAAAETAPTVKPEPTAVSDEGAAGPRPPAAEVPPSEEAVGEAMAPQTTSTTAGAASVAASEGTNGPLGSNGASEPPQALPITTTTSRTTLAVVAGGGSGGGIEQQRVVVARPKQRRRLNPLINVDYDTVPGVWEPPPGVSVGQQLTKRGRSPPPDYRHREWDRDRDVDRGGRYDRRPAMPHLPHPHLMAMGHGGMEPAGREMDMDPRDLMGHMGMGDDVYLDGGGGGDDDEDDEEPNGGGGAGTIGREHGGKDRDGGGGGGSGVTKRSSEISGGEGGRSGPAAPPAKPETLPLPLPAVFLPPPPHLPSPPASQLQGPIEVKQEAPSATNGMEAANRSAQPTDQNPSELSIQLPYPPEVKPETVQEPIGWDPHGAAAVYGDFGGGGDFYMDDGYGDDDQDDHATPPQVAPAEPTSGGHIGESAMQHHPTQQRLAEAVQSVDRLEDAGTDDHHHHDSASDAVGHSYKYNASGPTNLTESGSAMPSAVTQTGGAREDDDDSSLRHHSPSALRHSDYSRHPNGDVTADDFGKPPASVLPDADALFGDGGGHGANGGGGGGGGLSVLDLLNPMAAMGGMAGMGAHMGPLGPMGHMGALGAMQGLGMPSLMPGGMPSLMAAPGGDMLGALGLMPPIQPHGAGGAEGPGGGGMKVEGGGGQRSMRPERPGNGRPSRSRSRSRRSHSRSRDRERAVRRGSDRIRSRSRDRRDRDRDRRSPSRDRDRDRERERDRDRDRDRERGGGGRDRRRSRSRDRDRDRERDKDRDRRDRDRDRDRDRRDRDRR